MFLAIYCMFAAAMLLCFVQALLTPCARFRRCYCTICTLQCPSGRNKVRAIATARRLWVSRDAAVSWRVDKYRCNHAVCWMAKSKQLLFC